MMKIKQGLFLPKVKQWTMLVALMLVAVLVATVNAEARRVVDIYELSLDDNLETPVVKSKYADKIQDYQYNQAVELIKHNYEVELMRNNEVIIVTITADKLFGANDTILSGEGKELVKGLFKVLKNPEFYKMLLVMHSDDTGSPQYLVQLTRSRVNAVYDWLDANGNVDFVVPYALGGHEPLHDNKSMINRRINRRLEVYLVPGEVMIEQAKRGNININQIKK